MSGLLRRQPLRFAGGRYVEVKDPCPVKHSGRWHLFGTAVTGVHTFELLHATADHLTGPWSIGVPVDVSVIRGTCVAAPGVASDGEELHMFLQTDYNLVAGRIEHLVSTDDGVSFEHTDAALDAAPGLGEAGVYDPHPAVIGEHKYLVYSAFMVVGEPDVHLAVSQTDSWNGPWTRLGPILRHEQVRWHNQRGMPHYEWGLEGPQLLELPGGGVLLNGVCFLADGEPGTRQRVFLATADTPTGPYVVHGPALTPTGGDSAGENGHAAGVITGDELCLFFQERTRGATAWHYGVATAPLAAVAALHETRDEKATA